MSLLLLLRSRTASVAAWSVRDTPPHANWVVARRNAHHAALVSSGTTTPTLRPRPAILSPESAPVANWVAAKRNAHHAALAPSGTTPDLHVRLVTTPANSATNLAGTATDVLDLVFAAPTSATNLAGTPVVYRDLPTTPASGATNLAGAPSFTGSPLGLLLAIPGTGVISTLLGLGPVAAVSVTALSGTPTWALDLVGAARSVTNLTGTPTDAIDLNPLAARSVTVLAGTPTSRLDLTATPATSTTALAVGSSTAALGPVAPISITGLVSGPPSTSLPLILQTKVGKPTWKLDLTSTPATSTTNLAGLASLALTVTPANGATNLAGLPSGGVAVTPATSATNLIGMVTLSLLATAASSVTALSGTPTWKLDLTTTPASSATNLIGLASLALTTAPASGATNLAGLPSTGVAVTPATSTTSLVGALSAKLDLATTPATSVTNLLAGATLTMVVTPARSVTTISGTPTSVLDLATTPATGTTALAGRSILVLVATPATSLTSVSGTPTSRLDLGTTPATGTTALAGVPTVIVPGTAALTARGTLDATGNLATFSTTLYLRDALPPLHAVLPTGYLGAWVDTLLGAADAGAGAGTLFTSVGSGELTHVVSGTFGTGGFAFPSVAVAQYISPPLLGQSILPTTWTLAAAASSTALPWQLLVTLLLIDGNSGAVKSTILATQAVGTWRGLGGTTLPLLLASTAGLVEETCYAVLNGGTATAALGDYLVLELGATLTAQAVDRFTLFSDGTGAIAADAVPVGNAASALVTGQALGMYVPVYGAALLQGVATATADGIQQNAGSAVLLATASAAALGGLQQAGAATANAVGTLAASASVSSSFSAFYLGVQQAAVGDTTLPGGYFGGWIDVLHGADNASAGAMALLFAAGSGEQSLAVSAPFVSTNTVAVAQFISLPLTAQTIPAMAWNLAYAMGSTAITWTPSVFIGVVNGNDGTLRAPLVNAGVVGVPGGRTTTNEQACVASFSGLSALVQAGDYLVLEVAMALTPAATATSTLYADGTLAMTTDGAVASNAQSVVNVPTALLFPSHPVAGVAILAALASASADATNDTLGGATPLAVGTLAAQATLVQDLTTTPASGVTSLLAGATLTLGVTPATSVTSLAGTASGVLDLATTPPTSMDALAGTPTWVLDLGPVAAASVTNLEAIPSLLSSASMTATAALPSAVPGWAGVAVLTATASATADGSQGQPGTASMTATASMGVIGQQDLALSPPNALTALGGTPTSALDLRVTTPTGTTGLAGTPTLLCAATLGATASASADGTTVLPTASAALVGTATLTAPPGFLVPAFATLDTVAAVGANAGQDQPGTATLASVASMDPNSTTTVPGAALLVATASTDATNTGVIPGSATLASVASLAPNSTLSIPGVATLAASPFLVPNSTVSVPGTTTMPAIASTSATGGVALSPGAALFLGTATVGADAGSTASGDAALTPTATLAPDATTALGTAQATLDASTELDADAGTLLPAQATLVAMASASGDGRSYVAGAATLDAASALPGDGLVLWLGTLVASASATLGGQLSTLVYGQMIGGATSTLIEIPAAWNISPITSVRANLTAKHIALSASQTLGGMMAVTALTPTDLEDLTIGDFYPITVGGTLLFPGEIVQGELLIKAEATDPDSAAIIAVTITNITGNQGVISQSGGQASGGFYMQFNLRSEQTALLVNPGDPDPANPSMASYWKYGIKVTLQNGQPIRIVPEGTIIASPGVIHAD